MALHTFSILPGFPELRGMRTRLRKPRAEDGERLFALFADPGTMRWWPRAPMRRREEADAYLDECAEFFAGGERIDWVVTTLRDDAAIGTCTLYGIDAPAGRASLGFALLPDFRGRGLATDAAARALGWSARALGLVRFDATVEPDNVASQRVLERLGFAHDAADPHCFVRIST